MGSCAHAPKENIRPNVVIYRHNSDPNSVPLTKSQQKAYEHVQSQSISNSSKSHRAILKKIESTKSTYASSTALAIVNKFIEHQVPLIIHIHCNKLSQLSKDTHYRNLFETNTSSGTTNKTTRTDGETRLFGNAYDKAKPYERVKYGCLNIGLQPYGCTKAKQYGDGYLKLNNKTVRWRTTWTNIDSLKTRSVIGTLKYHDHILAKLDKSELKELIDTAVTGKRGDLKQKSYREIQIHGAIQLDRDVVSLHIPKKYRHTSTERNAKKFCRKNGCELVYF